MCYVTLSSIFMAFYLSPPGGNISLQKLTRYAITRFEFLCKIYETGGDRLQILDIVNDTSTVQDSECLIEGSVRDKVSHFILRLICCCDDDMTSFFIKAEMLLFDFRFANMTEDELCRLFKSVDCYMKHITVMSKCSKKMPSFVSNLMNILSLIKDQNSKWRNVIKLYLQGDESCFKVPFQTVLHFVATRLVTLKSGLALVPVCKLREVITSQFHEFLAGAVNHAKIMFHTEDDRMIYLIKTLKVLYRKRFPQKIQRDSNPTLSHTDIDHVVHMFPPCMSQLHKTLRQTHRLRHHSRVQYSLFLKEAGLPVHEALMFWRKEYSQTPSCHTSCSHEWSKNEKRYTYNIRHLYGLEGSRINYRGHSCQALQECYNGSQDRGGCPFKHFDSTHLKTLLHEDGILVNMNQILESSEKEQFSQACSLYFMDKNKTLYSGETSECWHHNEFSSNSYIRQSTCSCNQVESYSDENCGNMTSSCTKCQCNTKCAEKLIETKDYCCNCQNKKPDNQPLGQANLLVKNSSHSFIGKEPVIEHCNGLVNDRNHEKEKLSMHENCGESVEKFDVLEAEVQAELSDLYKSKSLEEEITKDSLKQTSKDSRIPISCIDGSNVSINNGKRLVRFKKPVDFYTAFREIQL